jgi:hypothetical protein
MTTVSLPAIALGAFVIVMVVLFALWIYFEWGGRGRP